MRRAAWCALGVVLGVGCSPAPYRGVGDPDEAPGTGGGVTAPHDTDDADPRDPGPSGDPDDTGEGEPEDTAAPELVVTLPERAAWQAGQDVIVRGTVRDAGPVTLTVDGAPVPPGIGGAFEASRSGGPGLSIVETIATDAGGLVRRDVRAVMVGTEQAPDTRVGDALRVRLAEGPGGLDTLEDVAAGLVTPRSVERLVAGPVVDLVERSCLGTACVVWYRLRVDVTDVRFTRFDVEVDPRADGRLEVTARVIEPRIGWWAEGRAAGIPTPSDGGTASADALIVTLRMRPRVLHGAVDVLVEAADVRLVDFHAGLPRWLTDVADFFGARVDDRLGDVLADAVRDLVVAEVPDVMEPALAAVADPITLRLGASRLTLTLSPTRFDVDESGVGLRLGVHATVVPDTRPGRGSLRAGWAAPTLTGTSGVEVALSLDALNQLLRAAWSGGLTSLDDLVGDLPVDLTAFGLGAGRVRVDLPLPPTVVPRSVDRAELQLGDADVRLVDDGGAEILGGWASATAALGATVSAGALVVDAEADRVAIDLRGARPRYHSSLEDLLTGLVRPLVPDLMAEVDGVALPAVAGFEVGQATVSFGGPERGWLVVRGALERASPRAFGQTP